MEDDFKKDIKLVDETVAGKLFPEDDEKIKDKKGKKAVKIETKAKS